MFGILSKDRKVMYNGRSANKNVPELDYLIALPEMMVYFSSFFGYRFRKGKNKERLGKQSHIPFLDLIRGAH